MNPRVQRRIPGHWFRLRVLAAFGFLAFSAALAQAALSIPPWYTDNLVLQQDAEARITVVTTNREPRTASLDILGRTVLEGSSAPREEITVQLGRWRDRVKADRNGRWRVPLSGLKGGGPFDLEVLGQTERIVLTNVVVGEVVVLGIEPSFGVGAQRPELEGPELAERLDRLRVRIRFLQVPALSADAVKGRWSSADFAQEANLPLSSVAFHFAQNLITNGASRFVGIVQAPPLAMPPSLPSQTMFRSDDERVSVLSELCNQAWLGALQDFRTQTNRFHQAMSGYKRMGRIPASPPPERPRLPGQVSLSPLPGMPAIRAVIW